jgi:hypothetical protein
LFKGTPRAVPDNRHDIYDAHIKHTINKTNHQSILKTENMLLKRRAR